MAQKTALYDTSGKLVMYGTINETFDYLRNIQIVGTILKVSHLSIAQINTLTLEQARKTQPTYIKE